MDQDGNDERDAARGAATSKTPTAEDDGPEREDSADRSAAEVDLTGTAFRWSRKATAKARHQIIEETGLPWRRPRAGEAEEAERDPGEDGRSDEAEEISGRAIRAEAEALFGGAPMSVNPSGRPGAEALEIEDPEDAGAPLLEYRDAEREEDERWERARLDATAAMLREARDHASDAEILPMDDVSADDERPDPIDRPTAGSDAHEPSGAAPAASQPAITPTPAETQSADPRSDEPMEAIRLKAAPKGGASPKLLGAARAPRAAPRIAPPRLLEHRAAAPAAEIAPEPELAAPEPADEPLSSPEGEASTPLDPFALSDPLSAPGAQAIDPAALMFDDASEDAAASIGVGDEPAAAGPAEGEAEASAPSAEMDEPAVQTADDAPTDEVERAAAEEAERLRAEAERSAAEEAERDAFVAENSLGSLLFGARATMGMHDLKEVERTLRIKARYLKAIEEVDPENLPSDAYLAGYVKSYAAYLRRMLPMSPEEALVKFKRELAAKRGQDPDANAGPSAAPATAAPSKLSEKVAPRISRAALKGGKGRAESAPESHGGLDDASNGRPSVAPAVAPRPTPADALRARAAEARRAEDPIARARRLATVDPLAKIERLGAEARAAESAATKGKAAADLTAARRKAALDREAARAAEIAKASRAAKAALRPGAERKVDPIAPTIAALTAVAVLGGLSYGAWSLLDAAQKVTASPEAAPPLTVVERVDPGLEAAVGARPSADAYELGGSLAQAPRRDGVDGPIGGIEPPSGAAMAVAAAGLAATDSGADAAIATSTPAPGAAVAEAPRDPADSLDLDLVDALAAVDAALAADAPQGAGAPQAQGGDAEVAAFALRAIGASLVRVTDASGRTVFAGLLEAGALRPLDPSQGPFTIRADDASQVAVLVDGVLRGPLAAERRAVSLTLDAGEAAERFAAIAEAAPR